MAKISEISAAGDIVKEFKHPRVGEHSLRCGVIKENGQEQLAFAIRMPTGEVYRERMGTSRIKDADRDWFLRVLADIFINMINETDTLARKDVKLKYESFLRAMR